jgi:hypothetical protein
MAREPEGSSSYPLQLDAVGSTFLKQGLLEAVFHSFQLEKKDQLWQYWISVLFL